MQKENLAHFVHEFSVGYPTRNVIGAGGIIYDPKNEKLLIVHGREKWSLPKGHKEPGEEPHQTAMREIYEETSLKVSLTAHSRSKRILKCIYYYVSIDDGIYQPLAPIDTNEVSEIRWVSRNELSGLVCNKQLRFFTKKWDLIVPFIHKYPPIHL